MLYLKNDSTDPYFNQAFEEAVFEEYQSGDVFLLWQNSPAVVFGKYQNIFREINVYKAHKKNIPLVRRDTGGGTVYHDLGNINFTFISEASGGIDYNTFLNPVINFLKSLGVPAEAANTSDIIACGKKISGNAQKNSGGRVLHHGTLLFKSDLGTLIEIDSHDSDCYNSKGIKSRRSDVANIRDLLPGRDMTLAEFKALFINEMLKGGGVAAKADEALIKRAENIVRDKYKTWEWTFGRCPSFEFNNDFAEYSVKNGVITSFKFKDNSLRSLEDYFVNIRLSVENLTDIFVKNGQEDMVSRLF